MGPRLSDWESRLEAAVKATEPFRYGASDCCMFAARMVQAMTGSDYAAAFRYRDAYGARRLLKRYGGVEGMATRFLGAPKDGLQANRGDVVLVRAPLATLGVCLGHVIAVQGDVAAQFLPMTAALRAWSV